MGGSVAYPVVGNVLAINAQDPGSSLASAQCNGLVMGSVNIYPL